MVAEALLSGFLTIMDSNNEKRFTFTAPPAVKTNYFHRWLL
jgi:hypothetical protein